MKPWTDIISLMTELSVMELETDCTGACDIISCYISCGPLVLIFEASARKAGNSTHQTWGGVGSPHLIPACSISKYHIVYFAAS